MKWKILLALVAALAIMASGAYADTLTGDSSSFQSYPASLAYNNVPYWDGVSSDGTQANIGNFLTETGYFTPPNQGLSPNLKNPQWFGNGDGSAATTMSFTPTNPNGSVSEILIEVAAYATTNTFGWYLASNPAGTRTQLFAGGDGTGALSATFKPSGDYGFYIGVGSGPQTYYYMDSSANSSTDNGKQHFAIFQASDGSYPGDFFIGCEDLSFCNSDKDFQDMVVEVSPSGGTNPVPLPPSALLLGSGLLGLLVMRRSKR
jgi:hypothetical protein